MKRVLAILLVMMAMLPAGQALADNGLIRIQSTHGVATTTDRLETILKEKGMTVFARIDHAAAAASVGKTLPPMELVIFGNPQVGSALMQCNVTVGIDLPQKALIWQDDAGQTWIGYNDPAYLLRRHGLTECGGVIDKVAGALRKFVYSAAQP